MNVYEVKIITDKEVDLSKIVGIKRRVTDRVVHEFTKNMENIIPLYGKQLVIGEIRTFPWISKTQMMEKLRDKMERMTTASYRISCE